MSARKLLEPPLPHLMFEARGGTLAPGGGGLLHEAAALHRAIFRTEVAPEVAQKYVEAHKYCLQSLSPQEQHWMDEVIAKGLDLEALEAAFRVLGPDHVLSRKFKIMVYIAEAYPLYFRAFVNEKRRRFFALLAMTVHVLRTGFKLLKGMYLVRTYRLLEPHA